jgi:hypothetical protein
MIASAPAASTSGAGAARAPRSYREHRSTCAGGATVERMLGGCINAISAPSICAATRPEAANAKACPWFERSGEGILPGPIAARACEDQDRGVLGNLYQRDGATCHCAAPEVPRALCRSCRFGHRAARSVQHVLDRYGRPLATACRPDAVRRQLLGDLT